MNEYIMRLKFSCRFKVILLAGLLVVTGCSENTDAPNIDLPYDSEGAILYSYAADAPKSDAYTVKINEIPYYVFPVLETTKREDGYPNSFFPHIVSFDITGTVQVEVTATAAVQNVKIRPESAGIIATANGNTVTFTISKPQLLSIEINDNIEKPLLLFANPPETEIPDKDDPNVIFFEEGMIHDRGRFALLSGQTVYIAPGAIVRGAIIADSRENIRIMGRGILSGELFTKAEARMIELNRLKNVLVEGITIVDSKDWTIPVMGCDDVIIRNVKIVENTGWADGIDIVGSRNVTVDGCFIHTKDDCIALKAGITYFSSFNPQGIVKNIVVKNSVIWNGKHGNGLEIGAETRTDTIRDVTFENIDLIHTEIPPYHDDQGAIVMHHAERAVITNVLYKDIRIEDPDFYLFYILVYYQDIYSLDSKRGKIENIRFENIAVTNTRGALYSVIKGYDATHKVQNLVFKNVTINGNKVTKLEDLIKRTGDTNAFVSGITYE
jgi:hypothetical protein